MNHTHLFLLGVLIFVCTTLAFFIWAYDLGGMIPNDK